MQSLGLDLSIVSSYKFNLLISIQQELKMSNKLKTASSLSADSTQVRYQKALKQISKLISVNTEMKQEMSKYQQQLRYAHEKIDGGIQQINKIALEKNELQAELQAVLIQKIAMHKQNQELKKEISKLKTLKISSQSLIRNKQTRDSYYDPQKITQSQRTIYQLQKMLQQKNMAIKQLMAKIKNTQDSSIVNGSKRMYTDIIKSNINNSELNKKLCVANDYIQKVSDQYVQLKNKLIKAQSKNKLLSVKSMQVLSKYTPQVSPRNSDYCIQSRNSEYVLKRYHKLQEQNKKYSKKQNQMKYQLSDLTEQNKKIKKQNATYKTQFSSFQKLIEKQQQIISQLHTDYETDLTKMTSQFKQKLMQQRESFSPAKTADQLNKIDALQAENKALKKKFQLCSIQLTKCFKTLEVYKAKLNQCERDYVQLVNERQQLVDRLTKLQSSHRDHRQKSIISRGSASRIIDNDRRNSMGQTGHFISN